MRAWPPATPLPPIVLIGQAPGLRASREAVPFAGQSGAKLQQWFSQAGIVGDDYWRKIYFAAITRCYPGRLPGAKGDRVPTTAEQALCRPWLGAVLATIDPPIVVPVGQLAIRTFLGKGPLDRFVGYGFDLGGRHWLPLPHPSGVSTWLNAPANQARVAAAMAVLRGWLAAAESGSHI